MINNQPDKDQRSVDQVNKLLTVEPKPVKIGWWHKLLHFGRLFGDVGHYVFDEDQHSEKIKQDILKIETEREVERKRLDAERDRLEQLAKKQHLKNQDTIKKDFQNLVKEDPLTSVVNSKQIVTESKIDINKQTPRAPIMVPPVSFAKATDSTAIVEKSVEIKTVPIKTDKTPKKPSAFVTWLKGLFSSKPKSASQAMNFNKSLEADSKSMYEKSQNNIKTIPEVKNMPPSSVIKVINPIKEAPKSESSLFAPFGQSDVKTTPTAGQTPNNKQVPLQTTSLVKQAPKAGQVSVTNSQQLATPYLASDKKKSSFFEHKNKLVKHFAEEYAREAKLFAKNEVENRYWHSMSLVRANLVKDQRSLFFNWHRKFLTLLFFTTCAILISLLIFGGLLIWENSKKEANRYIFDNLDSINKQIVAEHDFTREIDGFNSRLMYVNYLLDNHVYWTRFFIMLENRTVANVYYRGLSADLSGQYKIPAVSKNFADITNQINVMMANEDQKYQGLAFNGWVNKADSLNAVIVDDKTKVGIAAAGLAQGIENSAPGTEQIKTDDSGQTISEVGTKPADLNAPKPGQVSFILDLQINPQAVFIKQ